MSEQAHIIPSYTERLEQMLIESNIRLAAAIEAIKGLTDTDTAALIDTYVDDWHYLNQERGEFPGVPVPEWVAERWAKSDAEAEASIKMKAANLGKFIAAERDQHMTDDEHRASLIEFNPDYCQIVAERLAGQQ